MNRIMTTLALVFFSCAPALAEQAILEKAVPKEFEDYRSETEEATVDKLIRWFQGESDQYFVVEVDVGGPLVTGLKNTFNSMKLAMGTVEVNNETYVYDGEMFSLLIEKTILVRAYGTAPKDDLEDLLERLDVSTLKDLAMRSQ